MVATRLRTFILGLPLPERREPISESSLKTVPWPRRADGHNTIAMLARRDGETLGLLLKRLGRAIARYYAPPDTSGARHFSETRSKR